MGLRDRKLEQTVAPVDRLHCTKNVYKEPERPRRIESITFDVQSPIEISACSVLDVHEHSLFKMPERRPTQHGVLDPHMGISRQGMCETCGGKLAECMGHFGSIQLQLPVFHIGYFKHVIVILQCICKSCARLLLPDEEQRRYLRRLRRNPHDRLTRSVMFKKVVERAKRIKACPWCGEQNGTVKKCPGSLKILHDRYGKQESEALQERRERFLEATRANPEVGPLLRNMVELLDPLKVLELFRRVSDSDLAILDLGGRPENLLMTSLAVPPVCIRPSVEMEGGGGSNEDDITVKMMHIVQMNRYIQSGLGGVLAKNVAEWWDSLQVECAMFINSDLPGMPTAFHSQGKRLRGFVQRLKGKQGRFRGNLSGKRVDFTGRTVISPDPNVRIDEVVVPMHMAVVLTYPERVTPHNMDKLRRAIINGVRQHPGARFVLGQDGRKSFLQYGDRRRVAAELKVGDTVERHLNDGDVILFNRQPSLHRVSIMAFRARVMPWRTLRFNECVCAPFNADFDGDEMNIHVPQTEEARAEALSLMGVLNNLHVPKSGEILVAATQDFLTAAYLLTRRDEFFTRSEFGQLCSFMGDASDRVDLPPPALIKPVEMWTGKQLFSVLIRPNVDVTLLVTMETKEKTGCTCKDKGPHMCPGDGYVYFRNSELIQGRLGKATLGGGNKTGLFAVLANDYSPRASAACMSRVAKLAARFMGDRGFSIGIEDVTPSDHLSAIKQDTVRENYAKCDVLIDQYNSGKLELNPGCSLEQTLENEVKSVLNNVREIAAGVCMRTLMPWNSPLIQSQCGSKGSPINICQMVACVGQQIIGGRRSPDGFTDRSLPHFPRGDKSPEGKGFVANSFYTGLSATEFFFHTMAGREGLVDTAVKTAETGYMSRRLMKALEDLYVHYDGSVRAANKSVLQFKYGDDGLDPCYMESGDGQPLDLGRSMERVKALTPQLEGEPTLLPRETLEAAERSMAGLKLEARTVEQQIDAGRAGPRGGGAEAAVGCGAGEYSERFVESVRNAVAKQVDDLRVARRRGGLEEEKRGDEGVERVIGHAAGLTARQVEAFLATCCEKLEGKRVDPGATVGAYGAQSIGEPGTQMTLKTFHFAGVASMNVTLGVPRIKEIINAAKTISTPIIKCELRCNDREVAARICKANMEATALGSVCRYIRLVVTPHDAYLSIKLDRPLIRKLQMKLDAAQVERAILLSKTKLKLKPNMVKVESKDKVLVFPDDLTKDREYEGKSLLAHMEDLRQALPNVIVSGIPTVQRCVIGREKDDSGADRFKLFVEGTDLLTVMGTAGVVGQKTSSNHITEIHQVLGIEAARATIITEIQTVMSAHGMAIDYRHVMLLADCMTTRGEVLGITRFGIAKMKDSVMMLASFEKTTDHLFDAAVHKRTDTIDGVSESIIMGMPMPTGTGLFRVFHQDPGGAAQGKAAGAEAGGGEGNRVKAEGGEAGPGEGGGGGGKEGIRPGDVVGTHQVGWPPREPPLLAF